MLPNEHKLPKLGDDGSLMLGLEVEVDGSVDANGLHDPNEQLPPGHCESKAQPDEAAFVVLELDGSGEQIPAMQLPLAGHCESNEQLSDAVVKPPEFS